MHVLIGEWSTTFCNFISNDSDYIFNKVLIHTLISIVVHSCWKNFARIDIEFRCSFLIRKCRSNSSHKCSVCLGWDTVQAMKYILHPYFKNNSDRDYNMTKRIVILEGIVVISIKSLESIKYLIVQNVLVCVGVKFTRNRIQKSHAISRTLPPSTSPPSNLNVGSIDSCNRYSPNLSSPSRTERAHIRDSSFYKTVLQRSTAMLRSCKL